MLDGSNVLLEPGVPEDAAAELSRRGHRISRGPNTGGAQLILRLRDGYLVASEPRKDGQAVGF